MTTKPSDPSDVYPGANSTSVAVSWGAKCSIPDELAVVFDLYIGDPTLPMVPGSASMGTIASPYPTPNGVTITPGQSNVATPVSWNSSVIPTLSQPNHGCLLARVYPFGATPDTGDLSGYPSTDPHYAQHNCTVNATEMMEGFKIPIVNGNISLEPILVAMQAVPDLKPNQTVLNSIMGSLRMVKGFKQIATTPLPKVEFDLSPFKGQHESLIEKILEGIDKRVLALIEDLEGNCKKAGGVSARAVLPPRHFAKFNFIADLRGTKAGDAHILHVSQVNQAGRPYGGLTVVIVVI
jgi:hypothetical protein